MSIRTICYTVRYICDCCGQESAVREARVGPPPGWITFFTPSSVRMICDKCAAKPLFEIAEMAKGGREESS